MTPGASQGVQRFGWFVGRIAPWRASAAVRLATGLLIGLYVVTYEGPAVHPDHPHVLPLGLLLAAALVAGGVFQWLSPERGYVRAIMFAIDALTPVAFVWLYVFDPTPNVFVLAFVGVAQGALALGTAGGLLAWAITSAGYVTSEVFAEAFAGVAALPALVAMRVAAALFIALLVGRVTETMFRDQAARERAERELALTEESLRTLFEASPVALTLVSPEGIIEAWSPAAERLFGWTAGEAVGRFLPFVPEDKLEESNALRRQVLSGATLAEGDVVRSRKDGSLVEIDLALAPVLGPDGSIVRIVGAISDITERKRVEREIRGLNRALRALSLCNQAMIRITEEQELLDTICRILVVHGGYLLVWVGFAEHDEPRSVRPVAVAGVDEGFLGSARISWSDTERGRGPAGAAIRMGQPQYVSDIATDPRMAPWRSETAARGYLSTAALPLRTEEGTSGVLAVYSGERDAFDQQERDLLGELADDLAFGLATIRSRHEKERISQELREAEARYHALVDRVPAVVYRAELGIDGRWLYVSPRVEPMLGLRAEDVMEDPQLLWEHVHPDDRERVREEEETSRSAGERFSLEYRVMTGEGRTVWVRDEAEIIGDLEGATPHMFGLIFDVTERRLAEEELRDTLQQLRRADEQRQVLNARLLDAEERERARIAADIHDDSIQAMTAVSLRLGPVMQRAEDPEQRQVLEQLEESVGSAIGRLRNLIFELRPTALDEEGLGEALRLYLDRLLEPAETEWTLDDRMSEEPDPQTRTILYRIAHEALANVRSHARARRVDVVLEPRYGGTHVLVRDDGSGFDVAAASAPEPGHLGLQAMRERAELAGGWLRLDSEPGHGTTVEFWVPGT